MTDPSLPIPSEVTTEPPGSHPAHWRFGTTADVGVGARADSLPELFRQLALGLSDLLTDVTRVSPREVRRIEVAAPSPEGLVVAFLTRLVQLFDVEEFLVGDLEVDVTGEPPRELRALLRGEAYDPPRHPPGVGVKAVTLHRMFLDLKRPRAQVILDI